jgi:hypothetical protein
MDGFAVMSQRLLREPFGITRRLRPLGLGIAIRMKRDSLNPKPRQHCLNSVAQSPARTVIRYENNGPLLGIRRGIFVDDDWWWRWCVRLGARNWTWKLRRI